MARQKGSAQTYREALQKARSVQAQEVEVPSGFVWMLRPVNVYAYIKTGRMPQSFVEQFIDSAKRRGIVPGEVQLPELEQKLKDNLNTEETISALIFMRELVREACVKPRIVTKYSDGENEDEILAEEIDPTDFGFILDWVLSHSGVAGVDGLRTFREGREERAPAPGPDSTDVRDPVINVIEGAG